MSGCTNCGAKGGCDHRKAGMFAAIEDALTRLYPTRRWGERDDAAAFELGSAAEHAAALAEIAATQLKTLTLVHAGGIEEWCDYVYVLCFGRTPSLVEVLHGVVSPEKVWDEAGQGQRDAGVVDELYLRVALSSVAPFAAVQEVAMRLERVGGDLVLTESTRTGVFDPVLLPRMQKLVAVLAERDLRHLDFGDLTLAPEGFDHGLYRARYGADPMTANYLFFPQPASSITTAIVRGAGGASGGP